MAHYNMGNALKRKGELDGAIDSYTQALKIKPDYAAAYANLADALQGIKFLRSNTDLIVVILNLLDQKIHVRPISIARTIISLIKLDKNFKEVFSNYEGGILQENLEEACKGLAFKAEVSGFV